MGATHFDHLVANKITVGDEELTDALTDELLALAGAMPAAALADLTAQAALTAVPGSFADEAAVQTYLVTLRAEQQAINAANFTKINTILARLRTLGLLTP